RLLGPEGGDGGQLPHSGGDPGPQLLDRLHLPGVEVLQDLLADGGADVRDLLQSGQVEAGDVLVVAADGPGGPLVGPGPVRVAPGDREEVRVLLQKRRNLLVLPGHTLTVVDQGAGRGGNGPVGPPAEPPGERPGR